MNKKSLLIIISLSVFIFGCPEKEPTPEATSTALTESKSFTFGKTGKVQISCGNVTEFEDVTFLIRKATQAEMNKNSGEFDCGVFYNTSSISLSAWSVFIVNLSKYSGIKTLKIFVLGCSNSDNVSLYDLDNNLIESQPIVYGTNMITFNKNLDRLKEIKVINDCEFVVSYITISPYDESLFL